MKYRKFQNHNVEKVFCSYSLSRKPKLYFLRELIFQIAAKSDDVGEIEEALKWGNPSYLTHSPKSGTTIRLSEVGDSEDKYAISVHCQTSLIADFKANYPKLEYDGNRSLILDVNEELPREAIKHFIYAALSYHQRKKDAIGV